MVIETGAAANPRMAPGIPPGVWYRYDRQGDKGRLRAECHKTASAVGAYMIVLTGRVGDIDAVARSEISANPRLAVATTKSVAIDGRVVGWILPPLEGAEIARAVCHPKV